jgi:hypothetical protein
LVVGVGGCGENLRVGLRQFVNGELLGMGILCNLFKCVIVAVGTQLSRGVGDTELPLAFKTPIF